MSQQVINCVEEFKVADNALGSLLKLNTGSELEIWEADQAHCDALDKWEDMLEQESKANNIVNVNYLLTSCPTVMYESDCIFAAIKNQNLNMIQTLENHGKQLGFGITYQDCEKFLKKAKKTGNKQLITLIKKLYNV